MAAGRVAAGVEPRCLMEDGTEGVRTIAELGLPAYLADQVRDDILAGSLLPSGGQNTILFDTPTAGLDEADATTVQTQVRCSRVLACTPVWAYMHARLCLHARPFVPACTPVCACMHEVYERTSCVCVRTRACVCACVCACVFVRVCERVFVRGLCLVSW